MSRIALHKVVVNDGRLTQIMYNLYIYNYIQEYYCQYRCTHSEPHHSSITKSKTRCEENYFSQLLCRYSDLWMVRQVILIFNVRQGTRTRLYQHLQLNAAHLRDRKYSQLCLCNTQQQHFSSCDAKNPDYWHSLRHFIDDTF